MSLMVTLVNGDAEVPLEILPHEDFATFLERAKDLVGCEVDIQCLTGDGEPAALTDNVYEYFLKGRTFVEEEEEGEGVAESSEPIGEEIGESIVPDLEPPPSQIKIIEIGEEGAPEELALAIANANATTPQKSAEFEQSKSKNRQRSLEAAIEEYADEEIDDSRIIDPKIRARVTCHFCKWRVSSMKDARRHYLFEEKNVAAFYRNLSKGAFMTTRLVCSRCMAKNFRKTSGGENFLARDEFFIVCDNLKAVYREIVPESPAPAAGREEFETEDILVDGKLLYKLVGSSKSKKSPADAQSTPKKSMDSTPKSSKRKLELDGTMASAEAKKGRQDLFCRFCAWQIDSVKTMIDHGFVHKLDNRANGIPCVLCLQYFKTQAAMKKHVLDTHQRSFEKGYLDEKSGAYVKHESDAEPKKEVVRAENEGDDYLSADRLQKYLIGELDADAFFQQEYNPSDTGDNASLFKKAASMELDNDDDVIVWIVGSDNEDEADDEQQTPSENVVEEALSSDPAAKPSPRKMRSKSIRTSVFSNAEVSGENFESEGDANTSMEQVDESAIEAFQEVDYQEDPEYDPANDDDSDEEVKLKPNWGETPKLKCAVCRKSFGSKQRLAQHKCMVVETGEEKKDDLTCSICNETFLTKVRLQFHKQTHKEGGWQQMGCDQCPRKEFSSESELFDHMCFTHSKPFNCPYEDCNKTFKLRKLLKSHIRDHGIKKFGCHLCGMRFHVHQTLKEHMVLHLKVKPYQCHICQKYMSKASRLRMHLLVHTSQVRPTYVLACRWCDGAFKNAEQAEAHCEDFSCCEPREEDQDCIMNEINFPEMEGGPRGDLEFADPNDPDNMYATKMNLVQQLSEEARQSIIAVWIDKVYSCQYCEKVYYTKEALHQHRETHAGLSEPYQCHLCEATFVNYARCTAHKSTHGYFKEGGAPSLRDFPVVKHYLCDLCDKSNLLWTTVSVHYRHHHKHNATMNIVQCNTCNMQFHTIYELGRHRRQKHRQAVYDSAKAPIKVVNFSYKCVDCEQELPTKSALTSHRKVAHGEGDPLRRSNVKTPNVLVCSECGKTYATKPALLTHIKWHTDHGIGKDAVRRRKRAFGKGSHMCNVCGLGFYSAANLRAHIDRIHEKQFKFTCEQCGKGHFTHMEMETHKLTHTGERPFKCPDCPRAYVTKAILNKHYRNHTGERPYSCHLCSATFKTAHSRNYHKMKHQTGKIPAPLVVLEVKGGDPRKLQAALHAANSQKDKSVVDMSAEMGDYIKEELEEFQVNADEVLVRTEEVGEELEESLISVHEETANGVQIIYKRIIRGVDENGCENEYTIEYEESQ